MPRLDTEPFTMPPMKVEDYLEVEDTEADTTEPGNSHPTRILLPLRAAVLTPVPERFPLRHDTWGEITRDTATDQLELTPTDTWLDDWTPSG